MFSGLGISGECAFEVPVLQCYLDIGRSVDLHAIPFAGLINPRAAKIFRVAPPKAMFAPVFASTEPHAKARHHVDCVNEPVDNHPVAIRRQNHG